MKPVTKTPSNSLQIRLSPVGTLVRVVGRVPQRTKVLGVLSLSVLGVGSAAILATVATPPETTLEGNRHAAAVVAERFEHKGQAIDPTEALERAAAAHESLAQIEGLWAARADWDLTQPEPAYDPALLAVDAA